MLNFVPSLGVIIRFLVELFCKNFFMYFFPQFVHKISLPVPRILLGFNFLHEHFANQDRDDVIIL